MRYFEENQSIVIWGAGNVGTQIIKKYSNYYNIKFIVDNKIAENSEESIFNIPVYNPQILKKRKLWKDSVIVLCLIRWRELTEQLNEYGLKIIKDFVPWSFLDFEYDCINIDFLDIVDNDMEKAHLLKMLAKGKKICILYGMCHISIYKNFLLNSKVFLSQYAILDLPQINGDRKYRDVLNIDSFVWENCDLLIASLIYPDNIYGVPGAKQILEKVNNNCKKILVTHAAFRGYFPQHTAVRNETNALYFAWGDKNINAMIKEGLSSDEIEEKIFSEEFYDSEFVNNYFDKSIEILEREETDCNIKIGDYIKEEGKSTILYYSWTHPKEEVMLELGKRIFTALGLDGSDLNQFADEIILNTNEELVYPCVLKALGIEDADKFIIGRKMNPGHLWRDNLLTSRDYIKKYVSMNMKFFKDSNNSKLE